MAKSKSSSILSKPSPRISVEMKKASNGYIVSSYGDTNGDYREKQFIAKTKGEAKKIATRLLK